MSTHRIERLQAEIKQAVSTLLLFEVTDPLLKGITITRIHLTPDLGMARVYYQADGDKSLRTAIQEGFQRAKGFFRKKLASELELRTTPDMSFFYDETAEEVQRVESLFSKLK